MHCWRERAVGRWPCANQLPVEGSPGGAVLRGWLDWVVGVGGEAVGRGEFVEMSVQMGRWAEGTI